MSMQFDSAAYHEVGHMTAAIVQAMPIREKGLQIDFSGHGVASYFEKLDTDCGTTPDDIKERKLTIIALLAAHASQVRFYPDCDKSGWNRDNRKVAALLCRLHPTDAEGLD